MKRGKISNMQMALESYARKSNLYPWYLCNQKKKRKMQNANKCREIFSETFRCVGKVRHRIAALERWTICLARHISILPCCPITPLRGGLRPPGPVEPSHRRFEGRHLCLGIRLQELLVCSRVLGRILVRIRAAARSFSRCWAIRRRGTGVVCSFPPGASADVVHILCAIGVGL